MQRDLHHNIATPQCLAATTVGTTGTGRSSKIIDRLGYQGVEFLINYGSITATNATVTLTLKEGSATNALTSVADVDMLGTEALAGVGATAARTSGKSKNVTKTLGYIGSKRYLQISEVPTVSAGVDISIDAVLHSPSHAPAGATQV